MAARVKWSAGVLLLFCLAIMFSEVISTAKAAVVSRVSDSVSESIASKCANCRISTTEFVRRLNLDELDKQGHRGCRGLMPENTVVAMLKALELGVNTLEMDTVITNDRQVILSHEPFFNEEITTKPDGTFLNGTEEEHQHNVYRMNYSEVKQYDVGLKFHPRFERQQKLPAVKPLLHDVFTAVKSYCHIHNVSQPFYNIETKTKAETDNADHPLPEIFVDTLMAVIENAGVDDRVIIQSFDFRTLQYLHEKYPDMKTAMLIEDFDNRTFRQQLEDLGFLPTIHSPHRILVTPEMVEDCHSLGIRIIPWTINELEEMRKLIGYGVDGIITDYPDLFLQIANDVSSSSSVPTVSTTTIRTSTSGAARVEILFKLIPSIAYLVYLLQKKHPCSAM